jgi:hypothetical protein
MAAASNTNYVVETLVTVGGVVVAASLLAIPAVRSLNERSKRGALVATVIAMLIIPLLTASRATVYYIEGLDDFTSVPDLCTSDAVSQDQVAQLIASPPEPEVDSYSTSVTCDWKRSSDDDGDAAELNLDLSKYSNSREAVRSFQDDKEYYDREGTVLDIELGDEAFRRWYDGSIDSEDTLGVAYVIRIDNVILEAEFDHSKSLGEPDPDKLETLATDLVRELENEKPTR